jgi:Ca2+-binding EF-hand superfamily protein
MKVFIQVTALILSFCTSGVFAADAAEIESRFKSADKNGDGKLTLEEAKTGMPRVAQGFNSIDTEKKGYVTLDQLKAKASH